MRVGWRGLGVWNYITAEPQAQVAEPWLLKFYPGRKSTWLPVPCSSFHDFGMCPVRGLQCDVVFVWGSKGWQLSPGRPQRLSVLAVYRGDIGTGLGFEKSWQDLQGTLVS